ncbi:MAG: nucleotide exchange factor GrpE [Enterobacteriaceae bacterium PC38]|nr:MAG: nucleotide exchange factor GrpE [Enterobacteriaceae bacterium PC38]
MVEKKNLDIKKENLDIEKENLDIEKENLNIKKKDLDIKKKYLDINKKYLIIKKQNKINAKYLKELKLYIKNNKIKEHNIFLRYKAEIENIKKRSLIDIEKTYKFALENFIKDLLPVIDNLERSTNLLNKNNTKLFSYIEGIELTLKTIIYLINKYGIKIINKTKIKFNPIHHQAIGIIKLNNVKANLVIDIMQNGYVLHNRLLRPALVIVSK